MPVNQPSKVAMVSSGPPRERGIQRADRNSDLPLSLNQERRLLAEEWGHIRSLEFPPFHLSICLWLDGEVDLRALQHALNQIVNRHAVLRTTLYPTTDCEVQDRRLKIAVFAKTEMFQPGLFKQSIMTEASLTLRFRSIGGLDQIDQESEIQKTLGEELSQPFNYNEPPLMRAIVLKISSRLHLLVVVLHHLVADYSSLRILKKELDLLYGSSVANEPSILPQPSIQYPDFANWQNEQLQTGYFEPAASYWRERWSQFERAQLSYQDLPFALAKSKNSSGASGVEELNLSPELSEKVRTCARQSRVTLYMFFLAAFNILLHHHTGRSRIAVWGNFANRTQEGTENLIGWFANSHILGVNVEPDPSMEQLLPQVRRTVCDAITHQEIPLTLLCQMMGRRIHHSDLAVTFDLIVQDSAGADGAESSSRLTTRQAILPNGRANLPGLNVCILEGCERITLCAEYSMDRFPSAAIRELIENLARIATTMQVTPEAHSPKLAGSG